MSSEQRANLELNWRGLSGTILEGGYEAGELIEADSEKARFRIRVLGDRSLDAFMDVFRAGDPGAEEQLAIWQSARELAHKNLSVPLSSGRTRIDGATLIYLILRKPDETLSEVLRERALNTDEAREVLASVSAALARLHEGGFVHGYLAPEQIFAAGDSVNLSTERIRRINGRPALDFAGRKYQAPESAGENVTPEADVWCLGATLFEVLTRTAYSADKRERVSQLPGRFAQLVERCLEPNPAQRCKLSEIPSLVEEKPKPAAQPKPVAQPPKPAPVAPVRSAVAPKPRRVSPLIYAGLALLLVLLVLWVARPKHSAPVQAPMAKATLEPAPKPAPGTAWETRTLPPPEKSAPKTRPQPAATTPASPENPAIWRVILLTYAHEQDAQKKVQSLNEKHPDLHAEVFSPKGQGGPYLVTVGGRMTREEAARLRQKVISMGMPRDSYIQNYRQ